MSFLVGDASCGPTNALAALGKGIGADRSHQGDRFVPGTSNAPSSSMRSAPLRPAAPPAGADPASASFAPPPVHNAVSAFDLGAISDSLPAAARPDLALNSALFSPPAPHAQHQAQAQPAWAHDFLSQPSMSAPAASATASSRQSHSPMPAAAIAHRPMGMAPMTQRAPLMRSGMLGGGMQHAMPSLQQQYQRQQQQHQQQQQQQAAPSAAAWAEAFQSIDQAAHTDQAKSNAEVAAQHMGNLLSRDAIHAAEQDPVFSPSRISEHLKQSAPDAAEATRAESGPADQDALARAAEHLVSTVSHDGSDKFRQSGFLELMRKLADRQATIQGDEIVEGPPAEASTSRRTLDAAKYSQAEPLLTSTGQRPMTGPGADLTSHLAREDAARDELGDLFAAEDSRAAEKEARERQAQAQAKGMFVGDGGDVAARVREDEAAFAQFAQQNKGKARAAETALSHEQAEADEWAKYQRLGTQIPGASSAWTEGYVPPVGRETMTHFPPFGSAAQDATAAQQDAEDAGDFVGRGFSSRNGRGRWGPQESEWSAMQDQWEQWDQDRQEAVTAASTETLLNALRPSPAYRFASSNPYAAGTTRTHAMHQVDGMDWMANEPGLLEQRVESLLASEARVQADPRSGEAWLELGIKQQENEREGQAIAALRKALALNPNLRAAWLALAVSYTNEGDRAQARTALALWLRHSPSYAGAVAAHLPESVPADSLHTALIDTLLALVRAGARGDAQGLETGGVDADVQMALGVLFNTTSEYDKAADCFGSALAVRPGDWLLHNRLGATLSNGGQHERALGYYHAALDLQPNFARCHFNLAISCLNLKLYQDAAEHLYTALTIQHSQTSLPAGSADDEVGSRSLWDTFRVVLELLGRPDLADRTRERRIDAFDITDLTPAPQMTV